jgi:CheY-like chemotaxis protein
VSATDAFRILLIEDDPETLALFEKTLPKERGGRRLDWEFAESFQRGLERARIGRYDVVATDVYRDRDNVAKGPLTGNDREAIEIVEELKRLRFTPIVVFSDSVAPPSLTLGPFLRFADKSTGNEHLLSEIDSILETGVPEAARHLHDVIDLLGAQYLWGLLESRWAEIEAAGLGRAEALRSVLSRRAATVFGRLDVEAGVERDVVNPSDYYLYPRIAGSEFRLGDIVRSASSWFVVLTPHCHLAIQPGKNEPRVESALLASCVSPSGLYEGSWGSTESRREETVRRRTMSPPAGLSGVAGRHWFLPPFLDIPALYADFMDLQPVSLMVLKSDFDHVATLDMPFAEAMQACFLRFYGAIGVPNLLTESFAKALMDQFPDPAA